MFSVKVPRRQSSRTSELLYILFSRVRQQMLDILNNVGLKLSCRQRFDL